jgi:predicted deacylase
MQIHQLGEGTPEVAVVGAIHGDEPCGARAIEDVLAEAPDVERPVKLVLANEEALDRGVRYVEEDLNRVFPGDPDGDTHESRLAAAITQEVRGCTTLSLHSTQSYGEPFALVETVDAVARTVCPRLPLDVVVETKGFTEGRLIQHPHVLEVECGLQGSESAAENAYWLVMGFLAATGALAAPLADDPLDAREDGDAPPASVYRLREAIPKPPAEAYEVYATNFQFVEAGEVFAAVNGEAVTAEEPFYPVLLSAYGYEDLFGYAGERVGTLG